MTASRFLSNHRQNCLQISPGSPVMPSPVKKPYRPPPARGSLRLEAIRPAYFFTPDLERAICALEGITGVRVLSTGSGIDEIHVIAPAERPAKKIVRDIETLLLVRFGIRIDHRKVSVVQNGHVRVTYPTPARPQIESVTLEAGTVYARVRVDEQVFTGSHLVRPNDSELESASRALIDAIEQLLNTPGLLILDAAHLAPLHDQTVVLILLRWTFSGQQELLVGATLAREDLLDAAARATLDAINRKIVRLQSRDSRPG